MRILLVVHGYPPEKVGGAETYTRNLARRLARDHEVYIFTRTESAGPEYKLVRKRVDDLPVWAVRNTYSEHGDYELHYRNPRVEPAFTDALEEFRPDVVHFTYMLGGLSASYLDIAARFGARTVVTLMDFHFLCAWGQLMTPEGRDCDGPEEGLKCSVCFAGEDPYTGLGWWSRWRASRLEPARRAERLDAPGLVRMRERLLYLRSVLNGADVVISPTRHLRDAHREWGVESRRLPFAIDRSMFDGFRRRESRHFRLGFIGRLLPLKGLHILAEAIKGLPEDLPPFKLYVWADDSGDEEKKYLEEVKAAGGKSMEFCGTFAADEVKGVYEGLDALALPSLWAENSPMALLFALHTGTPVVASDIRGVRDVAGDESVLFYPPRDPAALRRVLEGAIRKPASLARLKRVEVPGMEEHVSLLVNFYRGDAS